MSRLMGVKHCSIACDVKGGRDGGVDGGGDGGRDGGKDGGGDCGRDGGELSEAAEISSPDSRCPRLWWGEGVFPTLPANPTLLHGDPQARCPVHLTTINKDDRRLPAEELSLALISAKVIAVRQGSNVRPHQRSVGRVELKTLT